MARGIEGAAAQARKRTSAERTPRKTSAEVVNLKEHKKQVKKEKGKSWTEATPRRAIGILDKKQPAANEGTGYVAMGVLDQAYRRAIDTGPTTTDLARRKYAALERQGKLKTAAAQKDAQEKLAQYERRWGSALSLALGQSGVSRTKGERRTLLSKAIVAFSTAIAALGVPTYLKAQSDGVISWRLENARTVAARREITETIERYEREQVPREPEFVRPTNLSEHLRAHVWRNGGHANFAGLFSQYLGMDGNRVTISENTLLRFDPVVALQNLWERKGQQAVSRGKAAQEGAELFPARYEELRAQGRIWRTSLAQELASSFSPSGTGESITDIVVSHLDWQALAERYNLTNEEQELLRDTVAQIDPYMIHAVFLTELMPSEDGSANVAMYDTLLRLGGREFVLYIPSLGDSLESVGPGQFTFWPLENRNASVPTVASFLTEGGYRELQIPEEEHAHRHPTDAPLLVEAGQYKTARELATRPNDIASLREHAVLTLFNMIGNLAISIKDPQVERVLRRMYDGHLSPEQLAQIAGTPHNNPTAAHAATRSLAHARRANAGLDEHVRNDAVRAYARRIERNMEALTDTFGGRDYAHRWGTRARARR